MVSIQERPQNTTNAILCLSKPHKASDTVFFKHKDITQPTVMPADWIIKAYQDLMKAIQGVSIVKGNAHMEAIKCIQDTLKPQKQ